jgi:hypothetical protein
MDNRSDLQAGRATFLSAVLTIMGVSLTLVASFLVCGGLTLALLAVIAGIAAFGFLHYLLWGHGFSRQVADERRQAGILQQEVLNTEENGLPEWTEEERTWYRRF